MDGASFFKTLLQSKSVTAPIQFSGGDETNSFPVSGPEVAIVTSEGDHDLGSSKLKIKNIVNFSWDHKYSHGQMVAAHITGTYLAYAITTPKNVGVVRVVNRVTEDRLLVKGMRGPVTDLSFAHTASEVIVGCVDSLGNLFVHRVTEQSSGLASERLLEVLREVPEVGVEHRLIWCPFLPDSGPGEEEEEEEPDTMAARLLVLTHGPRAEVWCLDQVVEGHGSGPLAPEDVTQGLLLIQPSVTGTIVDAAFSPDGSAIATASEDGEVKFFQVYWHEAESPPRCLHQWSPHGGAPVSSLFFLDDHTQPAGEGVQFWKFAITGCKLNSELKVWSCESWSCLQTVTISRPPGDAAPVRLKAALDPTANYLLLADIDKNLVFVLSLAQDGGARVVSTSEFATPAAFLSFCCVSAGRKLVNQSTEGVQVDGQEDEEVRSGKERTVVRLYLVQPKSLQECSIIYEDAAKVGCALKVDHDVSFPEPPPGAQELGLSVLGDVAGSPPRPASQSTPRGPSTPAPADLPPLPVGLTVRPPSGADSLAEAASKISLLSPDQFKPIGLVLKPDLVAEGLALEEEEEEEPAPPRLELVERPGGVSESGNSSPSREVANILSVEEPAYDEQASQSGSPDRTFQEESLSPSPAPLAQFPQPPAVRPPPAPEAAEQDGLAEAVRGLQDQLADQGTALARLERRLEAALAREQAEELGKRLEAALEQQAAQLEAGRREQGDALLASLSSTLATRLDKAVAGELKRSLPGLVGRALDGLKGGLEQQLTAGVKDIMGKTVNSPGTREAVGRSVAQAITASLKTDITESYRTSFQQQATGFERALQAMLRQLAEQFGEGAREYEAVLGRRLEASEAEWRGRLEAAEAERRETLAPALQEVRGEIAGLGRAVAGLARHLETARPAVSAEEVQDIVRREVAAALHHSRALSETSQPDLKVATIQQEIQAHTQAGRINAAFQTALSANDLQLVVFTCELLNTTQVFNSAVCPLSQSVLLSLIQQLSVDLGDKTEVKHAYLHEALVNLDPTNPTTKAHIRPMLTALDTSLRQYIMANPNSKMTRNMKMLSMACGNQMQ